MTYLFHCGFISGVYLFFSIIALLFFFTCMREKVRNDNRNSIKNTQMVSLFLLTNSAIKVIELWYQIQHILSMQIISQR